MQLRGDWQDLSNFPNAVEDDISPKPIRIGTNNGRAVDGTPRQAGD